MQFHRWLLNAYDMRIEGDYGTEVFAVKQDAEILIEQAKVFIASAEAYLHKT